MRRFIKTLALMAVAVVGAVSCTKDIASDNINLAAEGVTLYASTPNENVSTKVGFEDKDSEGIALSWEDGDSFKLYNSNEELVDTFTTTGDGKFTSSEVETKLVEGEQYTAKYNEDADSAEQNGDDIQNLNAACQMEATFSYGDGNTIAFAHTKAIMTFTFKSEACPAYLVFENGEESYKVTYTNLDPDNGIYTSHIMINPCDANPRTLIFSLYATNDATTPYDVRSVDSSIDYKMGYRYTAPISDLPYLWSAYAAESFAEDGKISSAAELALLAKNVNNGETYSSKTFTLTQDIDLSGHEWVAICGAEKFSGTFDGAGHKITGLYTNQPDADYQGLFGFTNGATIKNLSVSGSVTGKDYVGGVIGQASSSTIINCFNSCSVEGGDYAYIGGVIGNAYNSAITNCYNSGSVVRGDYDYVGGVAGFANGSTITNCYNSGSVEGGDDTEVGGVAGKVSSNSTITNCYWDKAKCTDGIGYDTGATLNNVEGMTEVEMQSNVFKVILNKNAYAYNNAETMPSVAACAWKRTSGYPTLDFDGVPKLVKFSGGKGTKSAPYKISCSADLDVLSEDVNSGTPYKKKFFVMTNDVNLGGESNEFTAIGNDSNEFSGKFDGAGYEISGLYINQPDNDYQALFGKISGATIKNLSVSGSVTGNDCVGGVVGEDSNSTITNCHNSCSVKTVCNSAWVGGVIGSAFGTTITNCYNSGSIEGDEEAQVGGVAGMAFGSTITNCYNSSYVKGGNSAWVGGVAANTTNSTVTNCYNSGSIEGGSSAFIGGIIGFANTNTITNCYWNKAACTEGIGEDENTMLNGNFEGMTTAEMQSEAFQTTLNNNAETYNNGTSAVFACGWGWKSGKYPYLTFVELAD